jgi:hypothetical protein
MRRQMGEAIHDLQQAEQITPEQTRTNRVARDVTRDLSSSPDCDPAPNCANSPSDSESCPSPRPSPAQRRQRAGLQP